MSDISPERQKDVWGMSYSGDVKYARDWCCQECHFDPLVDGGSFVYPYVVGFSLQSPIASDKSEVAGILIIECPRCYAHFWVHADPLTLKQAKKFCPRWPT